MIQLWHRNSILDLVDGFQLIYSSRVWTPPPSPPPFPPLFPQYDKFISPAVSRSFGMMVVMTTGDGQPYAWARAWIDCDSVRKSAQKRRTMCGGKREEGKREEGKREGKREIDHVLGPSFWSTQDALPEINYVVCLHSPPPPRIPPRPTQQSLNRKRKQRSCHVIILAFATICNWPSVGGDLPVSPLSHHSILWVIHLSWILMIAFFISKSSTNRRRRKERRNKCINALNK